jgi:hypothetical protein
MQLCAEVWSKDSSVIRRKIVDIYKRQGCPPALDAVGAEMELSATDIAHELSNRNELDDLCGLSLSQASELINFYNPKFLFTELLTKTIRDTVLTQKKIHRIAERKRRDGGSSSNQA